MNPRREAIVRFNELLQHDISPDCPEVPVDLSQSLEDAKPPVYADIGVIAAYVVDMTLTPDTLARVQTFAETPAILDKWYREVLSHVAERCITIVCPHLRGEMAEYEDGFKEGFSISPRDPETQLVIRGISTYVSTASEIYHVLEHLDADPALSPDQIHGSYRLLDSLAKLDINQFVAYVGYNMFKQPRSDCFPNHIELNPAGTGYQFKPGAIADAHYMHYPSRDSESPSLRRIGDIKTDGLRVGCPVTFRPGTTRKLWEFYVEARLGSDYTPPAASTPTSAAE